MAEFSFFAVIPERTDGNTGSIESHRKPQLTSKISSLYTRKSPYISKKKIIKKSKNFEIPIAI
ncbi:MAG: hypothetical protein E7603_10455 [Ruminococcaceae bacterium]|nr:hypothetical protein [Oscillospiraceae bacterium]